MDKTFIFGVSVEGENFTDRTQETERIRLNFENGVNTVLISPRRIGKTSLVKKVCSSITASGIKTIYMDIYDCRDEYDFYTRFATTVIRETSSRIEQALESAKEFLGRLAPAVSISPDPSHEFSISLGIKPKDIDPETILSLPEKIAKKKGCHIVICIDEFQQIGEFPDSIIVQKRLRGVWQHQQYTSYCLFGSKKHMMENIFQNRRMPFYMFGDTFYLKPIPTQDWIPFIQSRFASKGKNISAELAGEICMTVENHSSYVQQLAWNVLLQTKDSATPQNLKDAVLELINQCSPLFTHQTESLTSYQMNFLKAVCSGVHSGFGNKDVTDRFGLGSKSNITRLQKSLTDKELIDKVDGRTVIADPVLRLWLSALFRQ